MSYTAHNDRMLEERIKREDATGTGRGLIGPPCRPFVHLPTQEAPSLTAFRRTAGAQGSAA